MTTNNEQGQVAVDCGRDLTERIERKFNVRVGPMGDGGRKPICSAPGCHRTEDCGPFCRNRN